jgi:alpha-L-arabinofuranosidase
LAGFKRTGSHELVHTWRNLFTVHAKAHSSSRLTPVPLLAAFLRFLLPDFSSAQDQVKDKQVQATTVALSTRAPISKYIYGQFLEHIGGIVNSNIGAEMLDEARFYSIRSQPSLDVSAALSDDRKTFTLALLNPSDGEQHLNLSINGGKLSPQGHLWGTAPQSVDATIRVGQQPGVEGKDKEATSLQDTASVPPFSVNMYSFSAP